MRCFIALPCPDEVKDRLFRIQQELPKYGKLKPVEYENIHLTLKFLGEVEEAKAREIAETLEEIKSNPFQTRIKGLGAFPSPGKPRVVWAGVREGFNEVMELHKQVDALLKPHGFKEDRSFHPHFTLARVKHVSDRDGLKRVIKQESETTYGTCNTETLLVVKSRLTPTGPEYTILSEKKL
jgi:2'-5' RNA ligase